MGDGGLVLMVSHQKTFVLTMDNEEIMMVEWREKKNAKTYIVHGALITKGVE